MDYLTPLALTLRARGRVFAGLTAHIRGLRAAAATVCRADDPPYPVGYLDRLPEPGDTVEAVMSDGRVLAAWVWNGRTLTPVPA